MNIFKVAQVELVLATINAINVITFSYRIVILTTFIDLLTSA